MVSEPPPDGEELDVTEDLLWALADECNRRVLHYFQEIDGQEASLEEISTYVAKHHSGSYRDKWQDAAIRLHHKSLPQLATQGVIEYDTDEETVSNRADDVLPNDLLAHVLDLDRDD